MSKRPILDVFDAIDALRQSVETLTEHDPVHDRIALVAAFKALKRCRGGGNFNPDARREINSAFRLVAAALRIDVDAIENAERAA